MFKDGHGRFAALASMCTLAFVARVRAETGVSERRYSTSFGEPTAIFWLVVGGLGLILFLGGVWVAWKRSTAKSEVSGSFRNSSVDSNIRVKNVGQGIVMIALGVVMMIAAIVFIPKVSYERTVDRTTTTEEYDENGKVKKRVFGDMPHPSKDQ